MRRLLILLAALAACDEGNLSIVGGNWQSADSSIAWTPYEYMATWAGTFDAGTWDAGAGQVTLWSGCGDQRTRVYAYRVVDERTLVMDGVIYHRDPPPADVHYIRPPPFTPGRCPGP
jgi:hypothetical protein